MHDILEGILPLILYKILKSFHSKSLISIESINIKLQNINYPCNSNKPTFLHTKLFYKVIKY